MASGHYINNTPEDTGWVELTNPSVFHKRQDSASYGMFIRKVGNVVTVIGRQLQLTNELVGGTYGQSIELLTNLDSKFIPTYTVNSFAGWPTSDNHKATHIQIQETGKIVFFTPPNVTWPNNVNFDFTQTYLV